jgi:hypothetical protein
VEVDPDSINEPTSRVITPQVIAAFRAAAGDFVEAVCMVDSRVRSPDSYVGFSSLTVCSGLEQSSCGTPTTIPLTMARTVVEVSWTASGQERLLIAIPSAVACEVLARRIVHLAEPDRLATIMSTRYRHRQVDGDASETSSALEVAMDQHW